ncbi:hypothetical protein ACFWMP_14115 [Paenibacillus sp. NPDC058367]|uniref:DUF7667 family protein n=1 Tax=Paenibacillus sp. NPDC058367 TaxID=3346460 RepID=UPI0036525BAE
MGIVIHQSHRQLAAIAFLNINKKGELILGVPELKLIMPLLLDNLNLVQEIDGIKEASYAAQCTGNMDLVQHFCEKLEELEAQFT